MSDQQPRPKIIVDDDWKERVQAEKEALKQQEAEAPQEVPTTSDGESDTTAKEPIPPASFSLLITTLVTQALVGLGQIPEPSSGKPLLQPELAKHHIDTLGVLEEKTAGNLTSDESGMLAAALHDLRMMYIHVKKQSP